MADGNRFVIRHRLDYRSNSYSFLTISYANWKVQKPTVMTSSLGCDVIIITLRYKFYQVFYGRWETICDQTPLGLCLSAAMVLSQSHAQNC